MANKLIESEPQGDESQSLLSGIMSNLEEIKILRETMGERVEKYEEAVSRLIEDEVKILEELESLGGK